MYDTPPHAFKSRDANVDVAQNAVLAAFFQKVQSAHFAVMTLA
jgi:hypothetical protein